LGEPDKHAEIMCHPEIKSKGIYLLHKENETCFHDKFSTNWNYCDLSRCFTLQYNGYIQDISHNPSEIIIISDLLLKKHFLIFPNKLYSKQIMILNPVVIPMRFNN